MPTEKYRLMIYFGVATMHLYRESIVTADKPQTPEEFAENNKEVLQRVAEEAESLFGAYKYTYEQMIQVVRTYLEPEKSVADTKVARLQETCSPPRPGT